jgi:Protein of unknown function (DUF3168)
VSVESILRADLLADPGLSALIGDRLYLVQLPQNPVYPCGIYQRVSTIPMYVQTRGRSPLLGGQATVGWARFSFSFWSNDGAQGGAIVESIALALMAAMENVNLCALPQSPAVVTQAPNFLITRRMGIEPQTEPPLFKVLLDFKCWYQDQ